jgi:hypothetical protein
MLHFFFTILGICAHKLQIEIGRYCNPIIPRDERCCIYWQTVVEDEHGMTKIPKSNQCRNSSRNYKSHKQMG